MRIVGIKQNSPEWEAWRSAAGVIGASDAPGICGVSKHTTPLMLFNQKMHGTRSSISEFIQERGHRFEMRGYAMSGLILDRVFERDVCGEHDEHSYIRASFDGICHDERRFQEIKYVGVDDFERVKAGQMLAHYLPQVAQQAYVSGYDTCDFTVYNDQADSVANLELVISKATIQEVMGQVFSFRELMMAGTPPPLSEIDVLDVGSNEDMRTMFRGLLGAISASDKRREKEFRQTIAEKMPHVRIECLGVKVTRSKGGKAIFRFPREASPGV